MYAAFCGSAPILSGCQLEVTQSFSDEDDFGEFLHSGTHTDDFPFSKEYLGYK